MTDPPHHCRAVAWRRVPVRAAIVLAVMLLVGVGGWPAMLPRASAHAVLVSSSPLDGATVHGDPGKVTLTFDEAIGLIPGVDQVISATGARADTGKVTLSPDGRTITMPLRPRLPNGTYSAVWRVVSADTHVVSGSITFGIGVAPGSTPTVTSDRTAGLGAVDQVAQALVYAGLVLLLGMPGAAVLFWPWVLRRRRCRLLLRIGWAALMVGTAAQLVIQGAREQNLPWTSLPRLPGLGQTLGSMFGVELVIRLAAMLALAPLLRRHVSNALRRRAFRFAAAPAAIAVASVLLTGHAVTGDDVAVAIPVTALHLLATMLWLGGLTGLGMIVLPNGRSEHVARTAASLGRWSVTAFGCIAVLVLTGEYQAWRQISPVPSLWTTGYGVVLLIKIAIVVAILVVARLSQRRVRAIAAANPPDSGSVIQPGALPISDPPSQRAPSPAPATTTITSASTGATVGGVTAPIRTLRRAVLAEIILAAAVLAVTSVLVSEPPARATYGPPVTITAPLGGDHLTVTVDPTLHGRQTLTVTVLDAAGHATTVQHLAATLSSAGVASLAVTMQPTGTDRSRWVSHNMIVPLAGRWTLIVTVTMTASEAYATSVSYQVW